jgi:hypothetical protein
MWDLWWTKWQVFLAYFGSPPNHHSTKFSILIIARGRYNRPTGGRRAEWTPFEATPSTNRIQKLRYCVQNTSTTSEICIDELKCIVLLQFLNKGSTVTFFLFTFISTIYIIKISIYLYSKFLFCLLRLPFASLNLDYRLIRMTSPQLLRITRVYCTRMLQINDRNLYFTDCFHMPRFSVNTSRTWSIVVADCVHATFPRASGSNLGPDNDYLVSVPPGKWRGSTRT